MKEQTNTDPKAERPTSAKPEVQQELSKVAANPKQSMLILIGICGVFGYLLYSFFLGGKDNKKEDIKSVALPMPTQIAKPAETVVEAPKIPQLPEPPKLVTKDLPPPPIPKIEEPPPLLAPAPPPPVDLPTPIVIPPIFGSNKPSSQLLETNEEQQRRMAKWKSPMALISDSNTGKKDPITAQQEIDFVERGNMEFLLGRGKIIDIVLEMAVSSDFPGEIRALVSRDVFSESKKLILIPKGSRVYGTLSTSGSEVYGRVFITWNRIDIANTNYTLVLQPSPTIDSLGRQGVQGRVDNKLKEQIANAILISAFNIAVAETLDKIVAPPVSSQTTTEQQATVTNMQNTVLAISNDNALGEDAKIAQICSSVTAAITDKTLSGYTTIMQACTNLNTVVSAQPGQKLSSLLSSINSAAAAMLTTTAASATTSQAQEASKTAFKNLTDTFRNSVERNSFNLTTTLDQGAAIKMYVNKDYQFPIKTIKRAIILK